MPLASVRDVPRGFNKRLPTPPFQIREVDPQLYTYLQQLVREVELGFRDVDGLRKTLITAIEQVSVL